MIAQCWYRTQDPAETSWSVATQSIVATDQLDLGYSYPTLDSSGTSAVYHSDKLEYQYPCQTPTAQMTALVTGNKSAYCACTLHEHDATQSGSKQNERSYAAWDTMYTVLLQIACGDHAVGRPSYDIPTKNMLLSHSCLQCSLVEVFLTITYHSGGRMLQNHPCFVHFIKQLWTE